MCSISTWFLLRKGLPADNCMSLLLYGHKSIKCSLVEISTGNILLM